MLEFFGMTIENIETALEVKLERMLLDEQDSRDYHYL